MSKKYTQKYKIFSDGKNELQSFQGKNFPITANGIQSLLQTISHAKCYEELLVKG